MAWMHPCWQTPHASGQVWCLIGQAQRWMIMGEDTGSWHVYLQTWQGQAVGCKVKRVMAIRSAAPVVGMIERP